MNKSFNLRYLVTFLRQPWLYLTDEVTETITMCLVTLAQEMVYIFVVKSS